ncbi:Wd Repeat-Containing Protein 92 [Manis pentadactyla]|nr:Wd Repeat-Containing Protein 92 [Manis pentadactyla]
MTDVAADGVSSGDISADAERPGLLCGMANIEADVVCSGDINADVKCSDVEANGIGSDPGLQCGTGEIHGDGGVSGHRSVQISIIAKGKVYAYDKVTERICFNSDVRADEGEIESQGKDVPSYGSYVEGGVSSP